MPNSHLVYHYYTSPCNQRAHRSTHRSTQTTLQLTNPCNLMSGMGCITQTDSVLQEAQKLWERLLRLRPGHQLALYAMGGLRVRDGELDSAKRFYQKGLVGRGQLTYLAVFCVVSLT